MQIKFYRTESEDCRLAKSISNELIVNGNMKGEVLNILKPTVIFEYNARYNNYNYAYIPEFGRYYFISSVDKVNHYTVIEFDHDPLMNWSTEIKQSSAHVTRTNPAKGSKYLKDKRIVNTAQHFYQTKKLGTGFTKADKYIILRV